MRATTFNDMLSDQVQLCERLVFLSREKQQHLISGDHVNLCCVLEAEGEHLKSILEEDQKTFGEDYSRNRETEKDLVFRLKRALFQLDLLNRQNEALAINGAEMAQMGLEVLDGKKSSPRMYGPSGQMRVSFKRKSRFLTVNHHA